MSRPARGWISAPSSTMHCERGELFLLFQPIVDLAQRTVVGAEALVRWRRPGVGVVLPDDFIPNCEQTGLIIDIGRWVMAEACRNAMVWRQQRQEPGSMPVSVNVSRRQLLDPGFIEAVEGALAGSGLPAEDLVLEITETMVIGGMDVVLPRLGALKQMGVRLALDDFGAGYSSLADLGQMPIDVVKLDRIFARAARRQPPTGPDGRDRRPWTLPRA